MLNPSSRLIRITQPPSLFLSSSNFPPPFSSQIGRESTGGIRFHNRPAASTPENVDKMDNTTKNNPKTKEQQLVEPEEGDSIVESFGVDYATRAIEEGFGGVYGGNRPPDDEGDVEIVLRNHPEYDDESQGSEEKSRHQ